MADTDYIVQALGALRTDIQQVRAEQTAGFAELRAGQQVANGRTAKLEQTTASLVERTKAMICAEHSEMFSELQGNLKLADQRIGHVESRVQTVEHGVVTIDGAVDKVSKTVDALKNQHRGSGISKRQIGLLVSLSAAAGSLLDFALKVMGMR